MANTVILPGATIALPSGLIAEVKATAGENLLLQFPGRPITFLHPRESCRFLSSSRYQPLIVESLYEELIIKRNQLGLLALAGKIKKPSKGRKVKVAKVKELTLQQQILACSSHEEIKALLALRGINPEKKEVKTNEAD